VTKRVPAVLLVILAVAGLLRVGHWLQVRHQPFFAQLVMDSWEFDRWAGRIVQGDWLGHELFFQPPLYPYLLALVYLIAGHSYSAVYLLQILFGLAGIYALDRAGRLLFDESFGLAAAGLAALYGVFIFYDVQILKESLSVGFVSFLLWALAAARDKGRAAAWLGAGLLAGLWLRRRAWRTTAPAWIFILAWMGSTVVFFLFSRYRVPVVPALLLFAAVPLVEFGRSLKAGFTSKRALAGAAILLVLAAPHLAGFQYRKDLTHYNLGVIYQTLGRLDEAERNYRMALAADPKNFLSCVNPGILASGRKDYRAALDWYLKAAEIQPDSDGVQVDLGSICGILGDLVKAREHLDRALALNPENVEALHNKAVVAARQGAIDEALSLNRRSLELAPDWKPALVLKDKLEKRAAVKTPQPGRQS